MASNDAGSSSNSRLQKLEKLFMEGVYPDKKMRQELGVELGIEPEQIKKWFKNKFLSAEAKRDREENHDLRMETARLCFENIQIYQQLNERRKRFASGNPIIQNLLDENSRLKTKLDLARARRLGYFVWDDDDDDVDDDDDGDDDQLNLELQLTPCQSPANSSDDKSDD